MGIIYGSIIGLIKGDARSLDFRSDVQGIRVWGPGSFGFT